MLIPSKAIASEILPPRSGGVRSLARRVRGPPVMSVSTAGEPNHRERSDVHREGPAPIGDELVWIPGADITLESRAPGTYPAQIDRRLRLRRPRRRQVGERARGFRGDSSGYRHARAALHGLADHSRG